MKMIRLRRSLCIGALFAATSLPAFAQDSFSPSNVICGVVNFRFCDQGTPSTSPSPDAAPSFAPPPTDQRAEMSSSENHKKVARHKQTHLQKVTHLKKVKSKVATPDKPAG